MGSKSSKKNPDGTQIKIPAKPVKLSSKDYKFLTQHTGLNKQQIDEVFADFMANNPDGKLDKKEFARLYDKLRPEPPELIDEICNNVFESFDKDNNHMIDFQEFIVAYALTSRGDLKTKLDYAFDVYDADNNGSLTAAEVRAVIHGMLDMLGADKKGHDENAITSQCIKDLDINHDGAIKKDEFVNGLLKNYALRELMSPFN